MSCTGNNKKDSQGSAVQMVNPKENANPLIISQEEFNSFLKELGITLAEGLEFVEFKSEIPQGSTETYPTVFRSIYKVKGENYKANEDTLLNHYKKIYNEKLRSKGWTNSSLPGTGILDFHQFSGKIKIVSIRVTTSDEAAKTGKQEFTIELWTR